MKASLSWIRNYRTYQRLPSNYHGSWRISACPLINLYSPIVGDDTTIGGAGKTFQCVFSEFVALNYLRRSWSRVIQHSALEILHDCALKWHNWHWYWQRQVTAVCVCVVLCRPTRTTGTEWRTRWSRRTWTSRCSGRCWRAGCHGRYRFSRRSRRCRISRSSRTCRCYWIPWYVFAAFYTPRLTLSIETSIWYIRGPRRK